MFDKIEIFRLASGLANHAAARQSVIAENVANADTPGFRAKDTSTFAERYRPDDMAGLRNTRPGHISAASPSFLELEVTDAGGETSPNGNSVSVETEMMKASQVRHQHDLALSVYSSSLNILRTSLGRGR